MGLLNISEIDGTNNARLYVYEAGADILKALYSDENLTQLTANPLRSNSQGKFDACYVIEGLYRIVVTDERGDIIEERDNVPVGSAMTKAELLQFSSIIELLEDQYLSYTRDLGRYEIQEGDFLFADGRRYVYRIAAENATDHHIETAGGVKLYVKKTTEGYWPVVAFGAVGDGSTDDSEAFTKAFSAAIPGDTVIVEKPPVAYIVDNVDCPERVSLVSPGFTRYYNVYSSSDLKGLPVIRKKAGALGCINFEGNSFVSGLIFDGVDKSCNGTSQAAKVSGMWFFMVSMVRFDRGFGTGNTLNNSRLFFCHANQNDKGIGNLVDSHVTNCEINANRIGIDIQVGSNDTIYTGNKIEWNDEEGVRIYGRSASNIILGGVIDRNGEAGISVASSASLQVGDLKLRRNGRLSAGSRKCSHIYLEGNAEQSLTISNIKTDYAAGDSGEGDVTPQYTLASGGGAPTGSLLVTGSDLSGAAIGVFGFDHEPTNMKIVGCLGSDDWVTTGFPKIENGKMFFSKFSTGNISPGGTSAAITCELPPTGTQKRRTYGLQIDADNQSTGGTIAGLARFQVERDAGGARIDFAAVQWERSESSIGNTSGHTLQITISNVATDGSSFDVVIDNNHAGHTFSVDGFWI